MQVTIWLVNQAKKQLSKEGKVKVQFTLEQATKTQKGNRGIDLLLL
jgi:hypothetical protein